MADSCTLQFTQSHGRPTHHTFHSKLWQTHISYISLKVVADLRTRIHGTLRTNNVAINGINNKFQILMADTKGKLCLQHTQAKAFLQTWVVHIKDNKGSLQINNLLSDPCLQKPFLSKECMKYTMQMICCWSNSFKRMASSKVADLKGAIVTLYINQSKFHDPRAELHYSPAPYIT